MSLCIPSIFYTIKSEQYDVCTTKSPSMHDESSLSMEIETNNHKILINLWHGVKNTIKDSMPTLSI